MVSTVDQGNPFGSLQLASNSWSKLGSGRICRFGRRGLGLRVLGFGFKHGLGFRGLRV